MTKLKGNLVVGQSGGPSAVINGSVCGVVQEAFRHPEIEEVYGMRHGIEGLLREDLLDFRKEAPDDIDGLRKTPSSALGSCRFKTSDDDLEQIVRICRLHNIRFFMYAGGGDSMDTADRLSRAASAQNFEMRIIGVPKTIDNDLPVTDHSPGYGSAARYIATICTEMKRDAIALRHTERVKILETMGRNSGWLAAASALADDYAPDLIYLPERRLTEDQILADIDDLLRTKGFVFLAANDGLRKPDGSFISMNTDPLNTDAFGHPEPGDLGKYLADLVMTKLKVKARADKPGIIQRCAGQFISPADADEAYRVGQRAVIQAAAGESGQMITLVREPGEPYVCSTGAVPLGLVSNLEKLVPGEYIHPSGNQVAEKFKEYARPLIGGPLPDYVTLKAFPVKKLLKQPS